MVMPATPDANLASHGSLSSGAVHP
jgi:hypothetical protein